MVKGLELFKKNFASYSDYYVLIGGTACAVIMKNFGIEFRATKDLDIVLYIEALNPEFVAAFWKFVEAGRYKFRQKSSGKANFYRFYSPENSEYPAMLELFSRIPDQISLANGSHLTPIPLQDSIISLSAILLDTDYYQFIQTGKQNIDGLSVLSASHLIPLKARAWLDLHERKTAGEQIDEKDVRKHKNDVFRLYSLLIPSQQILLPKVIEQDMNRFTEYVEKENIDLKNFGLTYSLDEVLKTLKTIYCLS